MAHCWYVAGCARPPADMTACLYLIVLLGLAVALLKLPSYLHLALMRMHYYITGE